MCVLFVCCRPLRVGRRLLLSVVCCVLCVDDWCLLFVAVGNCLLIVIGVRCLLCVAVCYRSLLSAVCWLLFVGCCLSLMGIVVRC